MKIIEILEKTFEIKTAEIAKKLPVGEKRLREIFKAIGAKPTKGKRGWSYENVDSADLEKDISDFVTPTAKRKKETQKSTQPEKKVSAKPESQVSAKTEIQENVKPESRQYGQPTSKTVKKVTYEIDEDLHFKLRMTAFQLKKNVSELVEQAMREFLDK
jgi:predicted HicB family RNase H-like nuclease